jgi:hypothetical protein
VLLLQTGTSLFAGCCQEQMAQTALDASCQTLAYCGHHRARKQCIMLP